MRNMKRAAGTGRPLCRAAGKKGDRYRGKTAGKAAVSGGTARQIEKIERRITEKEELLEEKRALRYEPEYYQDFPENE